MTRVYGVDKETYIIHNETHIDLKRDTYNNILTYLYLGLASNTTDTSAPCGSAANNNCSVWATCSPMGYTGYSCACNSGFTGDGYVCNMETTYAYNIFMPSIQKGGRENAECKCIL